MKTFKCIADVERFQEHPLHATIKELVSMMISDYPEYRPQDDGYLVLIERNDVNRVLDDLDMPWRLSEVPFEAVTRVKDAFHANWIPTSQFTLGILVPDKEWLPDDVRRHLEAHI